LEDPDRGAFNVLGLVRLSLPSLLWWHEEDIDDEAAQGVIFRGYRSSGDQEVGYLLAVDVSKDPTEPDIDGLTQADVARVDGGLQRDITEAFGPEMPMVEWMSSHLNERAGFKGLVTAYIARDPLVGDRQFIALRTGVLGRKVVLQCCFNVADAQEVATPLFRALEKASFRPPGDDHGLKAMLLRDFGLDLPIAGGFGGSGSDPIVVTTSDPRAAAATEMQVLRSIGTGRQILWRTLAKTMVERDGRPLEQVKIEARWATPTEVITQRENYYFDVSEADPRHAGLPPAPGFVDPETGLALPYEIGWWHLTGVTDNETSHPGLGYTVNYGAPGFKATIYVYDKGLQVPDSVTSEIAKAEFRAAISDMTTVHPGASPLHPHWVSRDGLLRQDFDLAGDRTVVALGVSHGRFVKVRVTAESDPIILAVIEESLSHLQALLRKN
jgi:hypothetical protein